MRNSRLVLLAFVLTLFCAGRASASTFTVNDVGDAPDALIGNGLCATAASVCTLRAAMQEANTTLGADDIAFAIGSGVQTIKPASTLPAVMAPLTIDGTSQTGYAGSPLIEIDGSLVQFLLVIRSADVTVRGLVVNRADLPVLSDSTSSNVLIEKNWIGLGTDGVTALGADSASGVQLSGSNLTIRNNVLAGLSGAGIHVENATSVIIESNVVGLAADRTTRRPNSDIGIYVNSVFHARIGGPAISQQNIIVGNEGGGIFLNNSSNVAINGNRIADNGHGRNWPGILIASQVTNIVIGGGNSGEGNEITGSGADGIELSVNALGIRIEGNSIHGNDRLGIDLYPDGPTANDPGDLDDRSNHGQNFPVLTSAVRNGILVNVSGSLSSEISRDYRICVYGNFSMDQLDREGEVFIGCTPTRTDATRNAAFTLNAAAPVGIVSFTATATDLERNETSEFSPPVTPSIAGTIELFSNAYEITEGGANAVIQIERSGAAAGAITATLSMTPATATSGSDFTATSVNVTFPDGDAAPRTVLVPISNDDTREAAETFAVTLSSPTGGSPIGPRNTAIVTIHDDDPLPRLSVGDRSVLESNGGATMTFTVTLEGDTAQTVAVHYATADGSATAAADYGAANGTLTFTPGDRSETISISIDGDLIAEESETFAIVLSGATNAVISDGEAVGTITDDDASPEISVADASALEGAGHVQWIVSLSAVSGRTVTVAYATADGTAVAAQDYVAASGQLVFPPGVTTRSVTASLINDDIDESAEALTLVLSAATNATIAGGPALGSIEDDDAAPAISISDGLIVEGNAGSRDLRFTVTLSNRSTSDVNMKYDTANGTATSGADLTTISHQTLTIPAGETTGTISVAVLGDSVAEGNEVFFVDLSVPVGGALADSRGEGTIIDDDGTPAISISDSAGTEGNGSGKSLLFDVILAPASAQAVTVSYATLNGTALAGDDYSSANGTVTFDPGETLQTIAVPIIGDSIAETAESIVMQLSGANDVAFADAQAAGTIIDDDGPPAIAIDDPAVTEGSGGTVSLEFTVSLTAASSETITVDFSTADGSAVAPADYTSVSGTLTFPPGTTSRTIAVPIIGDDVIETSEQLAVTLSLPIHAIIADDEGRGTIVDDEVAATLSINDVQVAEAGGTALFTITLTGSSSEAVTVDYATASGSAQSASDFTGGTGTLVFPPGASTSTISVPITQDDLFEGPEHFNVTLGNAVHATISDPVGAGEIIDDDPAPLGEPSLSIADVTVVEGDSGVTSTELTVLLSHSSSAAVTVSYATADGTASAGNDYQPAAGKLTFAPEATRATVSVSVIGDRALESTEWFVIELSSPVGASIDDGSARASIVNDDASSPPPAPEPVPAVTVDRRVRATECSAGPGNEILFTIRVSPRPSRAVRLSYETVDGTAIAGTDYRSSSGVLTMLAGQTSATIPVTMLCDVEDESDETFFLVLSNVETATIQTVFAEATIVDDDMAQPNTFAVGAVVGAVNGNNGSRFETSLRLFNPTTLPVTGRIVFHPAGQPGSGDDPFLPYSMQPGESRLFPDLMAAIGRSGLGSIDFVASTGDVPLAYIRVYNDGGAAGTSGFVEHRLTAGEALDANERGALFAPPDLVAFRFNVGARSLKEGAAFDIEVKDEAGGVRFRRSQSLPADYFIQTSGDEFAGTPLRGGETIIVTVHQGALILYGSTIDRITNDPAIQFAFEIP